MIHGFQNACNDGLFKNQQALVIYCPSVSWSKLLNLLTSKKSTIMRLRFKKVRRTMIRFIAFYDFVFEDKIKSFESKPDAFV